jgi:hypothetical protein
MAGCIGLTTLTMMVEIFNRAVIPALLLKQLLDQPRYAGTNRIVPNELQVITDILALLEQAVESDAARHNNLLLETTQQD